MDEDAQIYMQVVKDKDEWKVCFKKRGKELSIELAPFPVKTDSYETACEKGGIGFEYRREHYKNILCS